LLLRSMWTSLHRSYSKGGSCCPLSKVAPPNWPLQRTTAFLASLGRALAAECLYR
jgi:hypothetical protein